MLHDFKRRFLDRLLHVLQARGVVERERGAWLRDLLEIDVSNAGRKFKGIVGFNLEEIAKIATALHCSADYLLGLSEEYTTSAPLPGFTFRGFGLQTTLICDNLPQQGVITVTAKMLSAPDHSKYIVWLASEPNGQATSLCAWKEAESHAWWMGQTHAVPPNAACHGVYAYLAISKNIGFQHIAVLDDRAESAEIMQAFLEKSGYIADTFTQANDLQRALNYSRFDAFVLDWSMGRGETTEALMQDIRSRYGPSVPIILLTGEASESDIERAIDKLGVRYFQKTGLFKPIVAQLKKDLREQKE